MNKLSRKNIEMLEMLATTPELEDKLAEYIAAEKVAGKLWKEFREAVVNGEGVKPVELTEVKRKFKAGDKVRVLSTAGSVATVTGLDVGDVTEVIAYKSDNPGEWSPNSKRQVIVKGLNYFEESALELVKVKSPNELRAEIIQRAKDFVVKESRGGFISIDSPACVVYVNFVVNAEKRTVVALLKGVLTGKVYSKGIAKCNPTDVFNAHIGKAIALGRALGKDVSEFENAAQPSKLVVGMVIRRNYFNSTDTYEREIEKIEGEALRYAGGDYDSGISDTDNLTVIDDTNAIYEEEM